MRLPILSISQDNLQHNFLNFLTLQKHIHNLKIFQEYAWNDFETDFRRMFLEYFENITLWLLEFAKRSTFVIIKSWTFNTKKNFHRRHFRNSFSIKCSLNVPWMSWTMQCWGNTQRIFLEYCVPAKKYIYAGAGIFCAPQVAITLSSHKKSLLKYNINHEQRLFSKVFMKWLTFKHYHTFLKLHNIMYFGRLQYKTQPGHHFSVFLYLCHCESICQGS